MRGSTRPDLRDRLHDNDAGLTAWLLQDPLMQWRNRITVDWSNAWRLDAGGSDHLDREVIDVSVRCYALGEHLGTLSARFGGLTEPGREEALAPRLGRRDLSLPRVGLAVRVHCTRDRALLGCPAGGVVLFAGIEQGRHAPAGGQHPATHRVPGQVVRKLHCGRTGVVHVLEHEQERTCAGQPARERGNRVEGPPPVRPGPGLLRGHGTQHARDLRDHCRERTGPVPGGLRQLGRWQARNERRRCLDDRVQEQRSLGRVAPRSGHCGTGSAGEPDGLRLRPGVGRVAGSAVPRRSATCSSRVTGAGSTPRAGPGVVGTGSTPGPARPRRRVPASAVRCVEYRHDRVRPRGPSSRLDVTGAAMIDVYHHKGLFGRYSATRYSAYWWELGSGEGKA